jgi:hypothetical protein
MKARWYSAEIGRFVQPDTIIPDPANPQSLNRYSYVNNRSTVCADPSGHCPWCIVAAVGVAILKAVDWGWTAWDTYQSFRVLQNPDSSRSDRLYANLNIALALAFEVGEPDEALPFALPADDIARRGALGAAREAIEAGSGDALEAALGSVPDWLRPMLRGVLTEDAMLKAMGYENIVKRTVYGTVDGELVKTIPDHIDDAGKLIIEIKDASNANGTRQIRAQLDYAKRMAEQGYRYQLHVQSLDSVAQWLLKYAEETPWFDIIPDVVSAAP